MNSPSRKQYGFTLIEVIAALALVMLLVGGIYSIAGGALELSRASGEARLADLRVTNLVELWRRQFENLPAQAQLRVEPGDDGPWLGIENSAGLLAWNSALADADTTAFGFEEGELILEQWSGSERLAAVTLIDDVTSCDWQFYDPGEERWIDNQWPHQNRRPQLAAVTFQLGRDPGPQRHVFRVASASSLALAGQTERRPQ